MSIKNRIVHSQMYQALIVDASDSKIRRNFHDEFLKELEFAPDVEKIRIYIKSVLGLFGFSSSMVSVARPELRWDEPIGIVVGIGSLFFLTTCIFQNTRKFDYLIAKFYVVRREKLRHRGKPVSAEKLIYFLDDPLTADDFVYDLNNKFEKRKAQYGAGFARRWYCWQAIRLVMRHLDEWIARAQSVRDLFKF